MNGYTPTVSYLTLLDRYILLCFLYLFAVAVQNCIVTLLDDSVRQRPFQDASALAISCSWVAIHIVIPVRLYTRKRAEVQRNVEMKNEARMSAAGGGPVRRVSMVREDDSGGCGGCWGPSRGGRRGWLPRMFNAMSRRRVVPIARQPKPPQPPQPSGGRGQDGKVSVDLLRGSDMDAGGEQPFSPRGASGAFHLGGGGSSGMGSLRKSPALGMMLPSQSSYPTATSRPWAAAGNGRSPDAFGSGSHVDDGPGAAIWRDNALAAAIAESHP